MREISFLGFRLARGPTLAPADAEETIVDFLPADQPIATCIAASCEDCPLQSKVHCHFVQRDLTRFLLSVAPSFLLAGLGVILFNAWWLIPWIGFIILFFGVIEIRVLCAHCPHYAEPGKTLQCWANYGSPRLWKFRPGPMTLWEKIALFGGFALIWGGPMVLMAISSQWLLLTLTTVATFGFFYRMQTHNCNQCFNFVCPLNRVDEATRWVFLARNPVIKKAFEK